MPDIVTLSDPKTPFRIECSRDALEAIRERAVDGLIQLPRIGMGVGGLLLGARRNGLVQLLNSMEIPCSHSAGPSFNLTDAEKKKVAEMIAAVGEQGVVGWYCSRTRGAPVLGDSEIALYGELLPGPEKIALVIRPSTFEPTQAAFYFRDAAGAIVKGIECEVEEWRANRVEPRTEVFSDDIRPDMEESFPPPVVEPLPAAVVADIPAGLDFVPEKQPVTQKPAEPAVSAPPPREEIPRVASAVPRTVPASLLFAEPAPRKTKLSGWILGAAACLALGAAAFLTQSVWNPRPPLQLTSTESNGNLAIHWNTEALRGIDRASLALNDGGNLQSIALDRLQLNQGLYVYSPKSQRVTAKLSAGDISSITVWFAPAPKEAATDAGSPPAVPPGADASTKPADGR